MSKKISQLTEVSTNSTSDVFVCNQSGDTKKTTLQKIADAIFGAKTDNNLPHFSGTPTAGSTAEAIEAINDDLVFKEISINAPIASLASGGSKALTANDFNYTIPTGYTPIGLYGYTMFGSANGCIIYELGLSSQGADTVCRVYNSASSATGTNGRVYLGILLVKTSRVT